ncbi:UNVERIFIED_CONTAM: hypothetical protein HHA_263335 [Hammondia hammondi]|eukprot:XP_008887353.1 hypothetical protein HHA_263335 [Hammondia hammondi]
MRTSVHAFVCACGCLNRLMGRNGKSSWGFFKATPLPRAFATMPTSASAVKIRSFASYSELFPSLGFHTRFVRIFKCTFLLKIVGGNKEFDSH